MEILLIEPFFTGSHKSWALGFQKYSRHKVELLTLSGNYWKWRMHGGAVTLARKFMDSDCNPNMILATDMLDLTTFLALTRKKTNNIPTAIYFHENQLSYPWSPDDEDPKVGRDNHYSFINYTSALVADKVYFNSNYHMESFLGELPKFLKQFPDYHELGSVDIIKSKSSVLHLGIEFDENEI